MYDPLIDRSADRWRDEPVEDEVAPHEPVRRGVVLSAALIMVAGIAGIVVTGSGESRSAEDGDRAAIGEPDPGTGSAASVAAEDGALRSEGVAETNAATRNPVEIAAVGAPADGVSMTDANDDADNEVADTAGEIATTTESGPSPINHGYQEGVLYVALYGATDAGSLGVLGEQDATQAVERAASVAADYEGFGATVVPTFEIIAAVASSEAGEDGDYSNEKSIESLRPWVEAAGANGLHVVLDLQSGRSPFHLQATEFEELLLEPHVSLALDPEWRVGPDSRPQGGKIGSVHSSEVNATIEYVDQLVAANGLPPKMLIVHQFVPKMIGDKQAIRGTENVQVVIHMDGFGPLDLKRGTYDNVATQNLPPGAVMGWKNFYDEDEPTPTPTETMAADPTPMFVSFQ